MALAFQSFGTKVDALTPAAIPYPASVAVTDLCIAHLMSKPFGSFPTWASFAPVASVASGSVANAADSGSVIATHAVRIATSALSGTESAVVTSGSPALGAMSRWSVAAGKTFDIQNGQGADSTVTGTAVSATGGALTVVPGDTIVITVAVPGDLIVHTARVLTMAGVTFSAITWTDFTAISGNDGGMYVGRCTVSTGSVTAAPVYTATSNVSGQSACSVAFMRLREITPALPGPIGIYGDPVVEPESHCWCAPVVDGNGHVWRSGESPIAKDTNRLIVNKSTDGGITWAAVDWANHPTAQDLESMWINKVGTKLYHLINRDDTVWLVPFNMSDDAAPNTYGTQEVVESGMSSTGVVQACTNAVLSTGVMHCIYSTTLSGANNQIGFKRRTAASTYSARTTFNDGAVNVTGPKAVVGESDVTYVFYKDNTGDTLYYRTISADGATVSARVAVATGTGISSQTIPHTNPIYYDDAGTEVIGIAYINDTDILKYRELRNGVLQTEETISTAAITRNPGTTDSQSAVASLAVDGKNVHAMWSRGADGDLMRDVRVFGTGWGTDTVVWASAGETGWYIYCDVVTIGTNVYLHYTYDQGIHVDDGSNINYDRILLRTLGQQATVNQVTETDTATALVERKLKTVAGSTETDSATALVERKTRAAGQAIETDSATALVERKQRAVTQALATETATALTEAKTRILGMAVAAETAGVITGIQTGGQTGTINQAVETDTATALGERKALPVARAVETDTGTPVTPGKGKAVGRALEADSATGLVELKRRTVAQAVETDTATALVERKARAVNRATETDTAGSVARPGQVGRATELDTATALVERKTRVVNRATETDTAGVFGRVKTALVGRATELTTAAGLVRLKLKTLLQATETDTARPLIERKATTLLQATELDAARVIAGGGQVAILGQAHETDTAYPITFRMVTPRPAGDVTVVPDLGFTARPTGAITPAP